MKNVALIGCGYWGKNYVRTLDGIPEMNLTHVVESGQPSIPIPQDIFLTNNYESVLEDDSIDGVMIVTPTTTHYAIVKKALEAGKHVMVEKPITTNSIEAEELCKIAKQKNLVLMVGHIFKYNKAVKDINERIRNGDIGDLRYIESRRVGLGPIRQDVDVVWDFATHDVYTANMITGKMPDSVSCVGMSHNGIVDDIASINLKYSNPNMLVTIYVNWQHPVKERTTLIGGSEKAILFDDMQPADKVILYDRGVNYLDTDIKYGSFNVITKQGDTLIPKINLSAPLSDEIEHFGKCMEGSKCISDGYDGVGVIKILEATDESRKKGGVEIKL